MSFVHASEAQARQFIRNRAQASGAGKPHQKPPAQAQLFAQPKTQRRAAKPRQKKRPDELPENMVEGQINDFLRAKLWTLIRQHVGLFVPWHGARPITCGEGGMADWAAVRVLRRDRTVQFFYYEAKGSGSVPSDKQRKWLEDRVACGFVCGWFDDFDGDWPSSFLPWYRARFGE